MYKRLKLENTRCAVFTLRCLYAALSLRCAVFTLRCLGVLRPAGAVLLVFNLEPPFCFPHELTPGPWLRMGEGERGGWEMKKGTGRSDRSYKSCSLRELSWSLDLKTARRALRQRSVKTSKTLYQIIIYAKFRHASAPSVTEHLV